jgi:hypothetical protein
MRRNWIWATFFILASCSGFRPPALPQAKLDADSYLNFAQQLEISGDLTGASHNYESAYQQYRSIGDREGQLASRSGIGRIALENGDLTSYETELRTMEQFAALHGEYLDCYPLLLKIHKLMNEKDYASISRVAVAKPNYPKEETLQLKIAKLQADSYLRQATPAQATELEKLSKEHYEHLKKRKSANTELISSAWYALAYYHFSSGNPGPAQGLAEKAADWDYRFGDFRAYGHSLWLMAQIAVSRQDFANARSYYDRALGIFTELADAPSIDRINQEQSALKGDR